MIILRRRLIFWLIKAYIKKAGRTMVLSFLLGLIIFAVLVFASKYFTKLVPISKKVSIGVTGAYTQDKLPPFIVSQLSRGLTSIKDDGTIIPDLASSWEELNGGKTYVFHLKSNQFYNDGKRVTSDTISYDFSDVTVQKPNELTVVYKLKDAYAPFLLTVSRPVFRPGLTGVGDYRITDIKLNGNFVQSLTLSSVKNKFYSIHYLFYPTEEAVKMGLLLGEVSDIKGLSSTALRRMSLSTFSNTKTYEQTDYSKLVALFFNTTDQTLSDKKIRLALTYALPNQFSDGQSSYLPYPPQSIYYNKDIQVRKQDIEHAKLLLSNGDTQQTPRLTITTLRKYRKTAEAIAASWKKAGVQTQIEESDTVPTHFQVFLGDFNLPRDPDQYTLWHSNQIDNITRYKNLRIDKLLEDGRKTIKVSDRKKIYDDFQKYLLEDAPAAFLYFPYEYEILRK